MSVRSQVDEALDQLALAPTADRVRSKLVAGADINELEALVCLWHCLETCEPDLVALAHAFTEHEWRLVRVVAHGLEWSYGWSEPAAQQLRFMLDFTYATGLRISELVGAQLGAIDADAHGDMWIRVVGKGHKAGKVVLPPLARAALDRYLVQRGLPVTPSR